MLYKFLCFFGRSALRRYFRQIVFECTSSEQSESEGLQPELIVANHPSVVLDGLLVAYHYTQPIWFVIRGALFRGRLRTYLFKALHYVPIYRRRGLPLEDKRSSESIALVSDILKRSSPVLIFPEGKCQLKRTLLRIKTGAARCALRAEEDAGFNLGLTIRPVGINYADFKRRKTSVTVTFGTPIRVSNYRQIYDTDSEQAVRALTEEIRSSLEHLTANIHDPQYNDLLTGLLKAYQSKGLAAANDRATMQKLIKAIAAIEKHQKSELDEIAQRLIYYISLNDKYKLDASQELEVNRSKLFLTMIGPLAAFGAAILIPVNKLISFLTARFARDEAQVSSYQFVLEFFLLPIYLFLLTALAYAVSDSLTAAVFFLAAVLTSIVLADRFSQQLKLYLYSLIFSQSSNPVLRIRKTRDQIIEDFEQMINSVNSAEALKQAP